MMGFGDICDQFKNALAPLIAGPAAEHSLQDQIVLSKTACQPGKIGSAGLRVIALRADPVCIAASLIKHITAIVDAVLSRLGDEHAVTRPVSVFIMSKIRHSCLTVGGRKGTAFTGKSQGLVYFARIQAIKLCNGNNRGKYLPACGSPAVGVPMLFGGLDRHGDPLVGFIPCNYSGDKLLAAFMAFFSGNPCTGHNRCPRISCPGTVFPTQGIGHCAQYQGCVYC